MTQASYRIVENLTNYSIHQMYDNICKFIAENFKDDLATWLLGSPIKLTELSPTELSLEPIRADSLILLQSPEIVLQAEFQTVGDKNIPFRMLDYRVRVYRRFREKTMRQIVIYLRKTDSTLVVQNSLRLENTYHQFEIIRLWEEPTEKFLTSPGLLPFAVLSKTDNPTMVLTEVAKAIEAIKEVRVQNNLAAASGILAGLVLEENVISKILRSEIMRESVIYQQILKEGKVEGKAEGKAETTRKLTLNLLKTSMSLEEIAEVTELSLEEIMSLQKEMDNN